VLCGATGRTGNAVAHALVERSDVALAAVVAPSVASTPRRSLPDAIPAFATLAAAIDDLGDDIDVLVDLTHAEPARSHLDLALGHGLHAVLGATGLDPDELERLGTAYGAAGLGLLVVPNFSIGAVLAMQVARTLAAHFPDAAIVETHHDAKRDAPSGTAIHTAALIAAARRADPRAQAGHEPARGESFHGVPVHALRLPGATAHQEVVFGGPGELVTIRHDAIDRSCYAAGVAIAARHVIHLSGLATGLEHAL
jgi:4-hydroxy-tetrahydrodipicolinate reductase